MADPLAPILPRLATFHDAAENARQTMLANLAMIGEIPAPTFAEQHRIRFLTDRFSECQLQNCSVDEVGNGVGVMNGSEGKRNILVVAHADTVHSAKDDHTITMQEDRATGLAIGDNSTGMAAVATLPTLLGELDIELKSNLILMGSSRSLGRGDIEGLRFFLDNTAVPIDFGVCVEGIQLGRLNYASVGMLRGEFTVQVPEEYDWTQFGASGAVRIINDVVTRINAIPVPRRPRTSILLGSIRGGTSFSTIARKADLRFEIRSESADIVHRIGQQMQDIADEIAAASGTDVTLDVFASREPGGVHFGHPLVRSTRGIMQHLGVEPRISPSLSELATLIQHQIPSVTLGITTGRRLPDGVESVDIEPMYTGLAQLIGVILAIDEGGCDDEKD